MWDLIVSVPEHRLSFYFAFIHVSKLLDLLGYYMYLLQT